LVKGWSNVGSFVWECGNQAGGATHWAGAAVAASATAIWQRTGATILLFLIAVSLNGRIGRDRNGSADKAPGIPADIEAASPEIIKDQVNERIGLSGHICGNLIASRLDRAQPGGGVAGVGLRSRPGGA